VLSAQATRVRVMSAVDQTALVVLVKDVKNMMSVWCVTVPASKVAKTLIPNIVTVVFAPTKTPQKFVAKWMTVVSVVVRVNSHVIPVIRKTTHVNTVARMIQYVIHNNARTPVAVVERRTDHVMKVKTNAARNVTGAIQLVTMVVSSVRTAPTFSP